MTDINTLIAEMRAGIEGVTPGEWRTVRSDPAEGVNCHWIQAPAVDGRGQAFWREVASVGGTYYADGPDARDAAHIARCSPSNIAALLDEIERLRAANTELQGIDATLQLALERAQRERDKAIARAKELKRDLIKARGLVISEGVRLFELVEKAERERDEARAALAPFARLADDIERYASEYPEGAPERNPDAWSKACFWPDLVAARKAYRGTSR